MPCTDKWWEEDSQNSRTLVLVSSVLLIAVGMITLLIKRKW
jgi:hypothetical protein